MKCPKCKSEHCEEWCESSEWWWHCYSCENDWDITDKENHMKCPKCSSKHVIAQDNEGDYNVGNWWFCMDCEEEWFV